MAVEEGVAVRCVRSWTSVTPSSSSYASGSGLPDGDWVAVPLRRLLERGRRAGGIRRDIPTAWLAESLLGIVGSVLQRGSLGPDDTVAAIASVFLDGARTASPPHTSGVKTSTRRRKP